MPGKGQTDTEKLLIYLNYKLRTLTGNKNLTLEEAWGVPDCKFSAALPLDPLWDPNEQLSSFIDELPKIFPSKVVHNVHSVNTIKDIKVDFGNPELRLGLDERAAAETRACAEAAKKDPEGWAAAMALIKSK